MSIIIYSNLYWRIFLSILVSCALFYTGYTLFQVYQYQRLTKQIPVQSIHWSINAYSDEKFFPEARYQYRVENALYEGQRLWSEYYLNASTTEEVIQEFNQHSWLVWIDPDNPSYSALQKIFPFKQCISTVILWSLLVYFFWMGQYVQAYMQQNKR